jgi:uncharacterized protein YjeT (DUF2065 family)
VIETLLAAVCVAIVLEGILYALFPEAMRRFIAQVLEMSEAQVRISGLVAAGLGVVALWIVRAF